jgi:glycine cleavage system H lipoate-binding protein
MLAEAVKWLQDSGILDKIIEASESSKDGSLTVHDVQRELEKYKQELLERMDEDRLRQLDGGITLLKDAVQSSAAAALATQALQTFHEIAALPRQGRTGRFRNRELICVAYLGMACAHKVLGDPRDIIAAKLAQAVEADPDVGERFLGKQVNNAIARRILPNAFFPLGGSPRDADRLFPQDRRYFVPPEPDPRHDLWVKEELRPVTEAVSYVVRLTHYSAQQLVSCLVPTGHIFPKRLSIIRQMTKCGAFTTVWEPVKIVAPLSGKVIEVNEEIAYVKEANTLAQDPYGGGWKTASRESGCPIRQIGICGNCCGIGIAWCRCARE